MQFYFAVPTNQPTGGMQGKPADKKGSNTIKRCVMKYFDPHICLDLYENRPICRWDNT